MDKARYSAVKALVSQEADGYSNLILAAVLEKQDLDEKQKAFCSRIFYGVIERRITLDYILAPFLKKKIEKLDAPVREILRAGVYQIRFMAVPASAAVNESVKLAHAFGKTSAAGMVNAVLRKAAQDSTADFGGSLSAQFSLPQDTVDFFKKEYPDRYMDILENSFSDGMVAVRVNTLRTTSENFERLLKDKNTEFRRGPIEDSFLIKPKGSIAAWKEFKNGLFHVQGICSQYAVRCLDAGIGQKVLDLCAAPGGKCVTIAEYMHNTGSISAGELKSNRIALIRNALLRCGITNTLVYQGDACEFIPEYCEADRVLCDVPCSGLGVLAKKPDIRYKDIHTVDELCDTQYRILCNASRYVKKGGKLVYSTCTLNPAENEKIVEHFLMENDCFSNCPQEFLLKGSRQSDFGITIFPDSGLGLDGFFVAVLKRD